VNIRYFFIKDRVKNEGIDIVYCPTEQMLADYFTKPLQGSLFTKFRRVVMGYEHIDTLKRPSLAPAEERVGNQESDKVKGTSGANGQTCKGQKESYADVAKRGTTCDVDNVISKRVRFAEKAKNERPPRPVILFDNPIVRKV